METFDIKDQLLIEIMVEAIVNGGLNTETLLRLHAETGSLIASLVNHCTSNTDDPLDAGPTCSFNKNHLRRVTTYLRQHLKVPTPMFHNDPPATATPKLTKRKQSPTSTHTLRSSNSRHRSSTPQRQHAKYITKNYNHERFVKPLDDVAICEAQLDIHNYATTTPIATRMKKVYGNTPPGTLILDEPKPRLRKAQAAAAWYLGASTEAINKILGAGSPPYTTFHKLDHVPPQKLDFTPLESLYDVEQINPTPEFIDMLSSTARTEATDTTRLPSDLLIHCAFPIIAEYSTKTMGKEFGETKTTVATFHPPSGTAIFCDDRDYVRITTNITSPGWAFLWGKKVYKHARNDRVAFYKLVGSKCMPVVHQQDGSLIQQPYNNPNRGMPTLLQAYSIRPQNTKLPATPSTARPDSPRENPIF